MRVDPALVASYSEALFQAALKQGVLDDVAAQMAALSEITAKQPKFTALMQSPNIPREVKEQVYMKAFGGRVHPLLGNFVRLLVRRGRIEVYEPAVAAFRARYRKHLGITQATVLSAVALGDGEKARLESALSAQTGSKLVIDFKVDPAILGRIRYLSGDILIDRTVSSGIRALRQRLMRTQVV